MALPTEKNDRKERPIARGVLDYFPDALAEVARVSFIGNQQHNPGEPLHWAREKSTDHADCVARHLIERGTIDTDGLRHTAKIAWRALAMLQEEIEAKDNTSIQDKKTHDDWVALRDTPNLEPEPTNRKPFPVDPMLSEPEPTNRKFRDNCPVPPTIEGSDTPVGYFSTPYQIDAWNTLIVLGCDPDVAANITLGTTFPPVGNAREPALYDDTIWVYLAGPMRGYTEYNFPAFDDARDNWVRRGCVIISPADIDRAAGVDDQTLNENSPLDPRPFVYRDFFALLLVASHKGSIAMLPGWEKSTGATSEFFLARWLGLKIRDARTRELMREHEVDYHSPNGLNRTLRRFLNDQREDK